MSKFDSVVKLPTLHTFYCYFSAAAFTPRLIENFTGVISTVTQCDVLYLKSGMTVLQTDTISATSRQLTVIKEPGGMKFRRSFYGALQACNNALLPNCGGFQPLYKDWWLCRNVGLKRSNRKSKKLTQHYKRRGLRLKKGQLKLHT